MNILSLLGTAQGTAGTVQLVVDDARRAKKALDDTGRTLRVTVPNQILWCAERSGQVGFAIQMDSRGYVEALWYSWMQRWTVPMEVPNLTASWRRLAPPVACAS